MGPTRVLSDPEGSHVGPLNLAIRNGKYTSELSLWWWWWWCPEHSTTLRPLYILLTPHYQKKWNPSNPESIWIIITAGTGIGPDYPAWPILNGEPDITQPDSNVHRANMRHTCALSSPGGPQVGPMNLAIWRVVLWCHQMETFSALLALCAGNSPVTGEFPSQRPVRLSFDVFFDLCLNKRLSKQSWDWRFEMPSRPLGRQCTGAKTETRPWSWANRMLTQQKYTHIDVMILNHFQDMLWVIPCIYNVTVSIKLLFNKVNFYCFRWAFQFSYEKCIYIYLCVYFAKQNVIQSNVMASDHYLHALEGRECSCLNYGYVTFLFSHNNFVNVIHVETRMGRRRNWGSVMHRGFRNLFRYINRMGCWPWVCWIFVCRNYSSKP